MIDVAEMDLLMQITSDFAVMVVLKLFHNVFALPSITSEQ